MSTGKEEVSYNSKAACCEGLRRKAEGCKTLPGVRRRQPTYLSRQLFLCAFVSVLITPRWIPVHLFNTVNTVNVIFRADS